MEKGKIISKGISFTKVNLKMENIMEKGNII